MAFSAFKPIVYCDVVLLTWAEVVMALQLFPHATNSLEKLWCVGMAYDCYLAFVAFQHDDRNFAGRFLLILREAGHQRRLFGV